MRLSQQRGWDQSCKGRLLPRTILLLNSKDPACPKSFRGREGISVPPPDKVLFMSLSPSQRLAYD